MKTLNIIEKLYISGILSLRKIFPSRYLFSLKPLEIITYEPKEMRKQKMSVNTVIS